MEDKVRSFNNLPRPKQTPTRLPNHWVFGVCHVDLNPPGDLLLAVHPESRYVKQAGPAQILSLTTTSDKAEAAVLYLLDAFAARGYDPDEPLVAPWSWSTLDADTARALEESLKNHGVRAELCKVGVCTADERAILEEAREGLMDTMLQTMGYRPRQPVAVDPGDFSKCHGCGMSKECFFQPLKKCARCEQAYYHSRDCQKSHWKRHKPTCSPADAATASASASTSDLDAHKYYNTKAFADPNARELLHSLHLDQSHPRHGAIAQVFRFFLSTE